MLMHSIAWQKLYHDSTVTVYSVRPRLVSLTLHTVRDDRDSLVHVVWLSNTRSQKQKPSLCIALRGKNCIT